MVEYSCVGVPHSGSLRKVRSATSGKAELAVPTLAIAEVPVAELPVRDRLLIWENSQLIKFRVEHEGKSEDKNDAAQSEATDPSAEGLVIEKFNEDWCWQTQRCRVRAHFAHRD